MIYTQYHQILEVLNKIDPLKYGKSRNYIDGAVTMLSPYISRGVLSTKQVLGSVLERGYKLNQIESFVRELAWRDYFQLVWIAKKNAIDSDLKNTQTNVNHSFIPDSVLNHSTSIMAIDQSIQHLYSKGYMHNHVRMYVASICCNIAQSHWLLPAQWMYYHLLDADWASNALSWQWVAGCFSSKKYYCNQENINKYCYTNQVNTFLDYSYEELTISKIPKELYKTSKPLFTTLLPSLAPIQLDSAKPIYIYNFYNLDSNWDTTLDASRILLFEPSFYKKYPVGDHTINFIIELSKNIKGLQMVVGEFDEVFKNIPSSIIHYKEHPTNSHYKGNRHNRDWMNEKVSGYFPSFFSFWKQYEKGLGI